MKNITIVILGGTGDLAKKKLLPAILALTQRKVIDRVQVIATGRRPLDAKAYAEIVGFEANAHITLHYLQADFTQKKSLTDLGPLLAQIEDADTVGRLFYLAISPSYFKDVAKKISHCCTDTAVFNRIMIEKPFGYDLKSSQQLNKSLTKYFDEKDIFRVDHYLGKETVQNILALRLANPFFERTWNSAFIDSIKIIVSENMGVGDRIEYYDNSGAVRDMIQNHLLQMLSLVIMDAPQSITPEDVHEKKRNALKALSLAKISVGQYAGYLDEIQKYGKTHSDTETLVKLELASKSKRWKGTKIILMTGKNLAERYALIEINYKKEPCTIYCDIKTNPNRLVLHVQPTQDITFHMNTLVPASNMDIAHVNMNFCKECAFSANSPESYEIILEECIKGQKTLFITEPELASAWKLVDTIRTQMPKPIIYAKGSRIESAV